MDNRFGNNGMRIVSLAFMMVLLTGCVTGSRGFPPVHGIANLDSVDARVWRGAQPNRMALGWLKSQGVRTVINLRDDPWPDEARICAELGMDYRSVPMSGISAPEMSDVLRVLRFIRQADGLVFIHCVYGCERTSVVIACHRIRNGTTPEVALADAKFHSMSPWVKGMKRFILHFQ
jgi:protein tyrosine phosphatase (PTP) superfamily phosphohydrolase (DUF442 family)